MLQAADVEPGRDQGTLADRGGIGDVTRGIDRRGAHQLTQERDRFFGIDGGEDRAGVVIAESDRKRGVHAMGSLFTNRASDTRMSVEGPVY